MIKGINKVDIFLIVSLSLLISFTVVIIYLSTIYPESSVLSTLITAFFGVFGTEIASCCVIKSLNIRNERLQIQNEMDGGVG